MAEKFPNLKALTVHLAYFNADGGTKNGEVRYTVNVQHAKSVFSFVCQSGECTEGGFDLSGAVAGAVTGRRKEVDGEVRCPGWCTKPKQDKAPCHNLLRYKLSLIYV
jgi:hypothetical protein